ncbi:hypothetical protein ACIBG5_20240 [Kribbella sp. NPDC050241]|uniref:hypothetical protein n=1 Tax=Kribbella sp. NPDC050241 TaxID=3364115 RepID=UPI003788AA5D
MNDERRHVPGLDAAKPTAYAVLLGAEITAEAERRRRGRRPLQLDYAQEGDETRSSFV